MTTQRQLDDAKMPLDHPYSGRPHRVYVALTNHCNRSCPWCSTCSSPSRNTFLPPERFLEAIPPEGDFEIQLEGGEPTTHPQFDHFVRTACSLPGMQRLILCTNGALLPRRRPALRRWLERLGQPCTLKLSFNHYLYRHDPKLLELAVAVKDVFENLGGDRLLVLNVRLRPNHAEEETWLKRAVQQAALANCANIFYLQRYGFAAGQQDWEPPVLAGHNFRLVNPDGTVFDDDLVARSEAMRHLP